MAFSRSPVLFLAAAGKLLGLEVNTHAVHAQAAHGLLSSGCMHHPHELEYDAHEEEYWTLELANSRPVPLRASADWMAWGSKLDAKTAETKRSVAKRD
jgi:hypothetical protein